MLGSRSIDRFRISDLLAPCGRGVYPQCAGGRLPATTHPSFPAVGHVPRLSTSAGFRISQPLPLTKGGRVEIQNSKFKIQNSNRGTLVTTKFSRFSGFAHA